MVPFAEIRSQAKFYWKLIQAILCTILITSFHSDKLVIQQDIGISLDLLEHVRIGQCCLELL